jgi:hypothetical protein
VLALDFIRKHPEEVKRAAELKGEPAPVDDILALDQRWREATGRAETARAEQNALSKEFAKSRDQSLLTRTKELAETVKGLTADADRLRGQLDDLLLRVPNVFHESVPVGESYDENVVVREWGTKPTFSFEPRPHYEIGEALGIMDFERAARVSGSRFAFLIGDPKTDPTFAARARDVRALGVEDLAQHLRREVQRLPRRHRHGLQPHEHRPQGLEAGRLLLHHARPVRHLGDRVRL